MWSGLGIGRSPFNIPFFLWQNCLAAFCVAVLYQLLGRTPTARGCGAVFYRRRMLMNLICISLPHIFILSKEVHINKPSVL